MGQLAITLFGRFGVSVDGQPINVGGPKQQALLAYLAYYAGTEVDREELIGLLWGDRFDDQARQSLRQALARLRRALDQAGVAPLATEADTILFRADAATVDVAEFRALAGTSEAFEEASALYGQLLRGMNIRQEGFDAWLGRERESLAQQIAAIYARLSTDLAEIASWPGAIAGAENWAALDPLNEAAVRQVMHCRNNNGDKAGALKRYQDLRDLLRGELDAEPATETADLAEEIRTGSSAVAAPIEAEQEIAKPAPTTPAGIELPEHDGISISILPFQCASDSLEHQGFAALVCDMITEAASSSITRIRAVRPGLATQDGRDPKMLGEKLSVEYLLDGTIVWLGQRARATAQLLRTDNGSVVWSDHFDAEADDVFELSSRIAANVGNTLGYKLMLERPAASRRMSNSDLRVDMHRAAALFFKFQKEDNDAALEIVEQAVEIHGSHFQPMFLLANCYLNRSIFSWSEDRETDSARSAEIAGYLIAQEPDNTRAHVVKGLSDLNLGDPTSALAHADRAIALSSSNGLAYRLRASAKLNLGRYEEACADATMSMTLNPYAPALFADYSILGMAKYNQGRYDEAVIAHQTAVSLKPDLAFTNFMLAADHAELGELERAKQYLQIALALTPNATVDDILTNATSVNEALKDRIKTSLRKAGWEPPRPEPASEDLAPPDSPSIAVLPFENMSGDVEQEYFSDGMTEDIITALSRLRWLSVIARNSTFTYKGRAVDVKVVGREMGVRYVLEGSVRKAGGRLRVSAQLIEAASGKHIWAQRYDRDLADIFDLQDELTEAISAEVDAELAGSERTRAHRKTAADLDAWELYQRAMWHLYKFTKDDAAEARRLFQRATDQAPEFADAHAGLATIANQTVLFGFTQDRTATLERGLRHAEMAVALDDRNDFSHFVLGRICTSLNDRDRAISAYEKAIDLNPNSALAHSGLGDALYRFGRAEEAIPLISRAIRLSPHAPALWSFHLIRSISHSLLDEPDQAIIDAKAAVQAKSDEFWCHVALAYARALQGNYDAARAAYDRACELKPELSTAYIRSLTGAIHPPYMESFIATMREAGLLED